jgi:hypothetical protein
LYSLKEVQLARKNMVEALANFSLHSVPEETVFRAVVEKHELKKLVVCHL